MSGLYKFFRRDLQRIWTNVVAMVVIMGLAVIPSLYAWFNILSNWDPYAETATRQLSVAVANEDRGADLDGVKLAIGNIVVDKLKANSSIGWVFVDDAKSAQEGVKSGQYYAALVIDGDFSSNMLSFIGGNLKHPMIDYFENQKKNAIAPKITGKVKTTVQEEVNQAFVSALAQGVLSAGKYISTTEGANRLTDSALEHLKQMDEDMSSSLRVIDSYIALADSADQLRAASQSLSKQMQEALKESQNRISQVQKESARDLAGIKNANAGQSGSGQSGADQIRQQLDISLAHLDAIMQDLSGSRIPSDQELGQTIAILQAVDAQLQNAFSGVSLPSIIQNRLDQWHQRNQSLQTRLQAIISARQAGGDLLRLQKDALEDAKQLREGAKQLREDFVSQIQPKLQASVDSVKNSLRESTTLLGDTGKRVDQIRSLLESYPDLSGRGKESLKQAKEELTQLQSQLRDLISHLSSMTTSDQYQNFLSLLQSDPELIASFISSPVALDQEPVYSIANNGSAMSAFYVILAIWVGALIQVAILHPRQKHTETIPGIKPWHSFWGRYLIFFLLGQIQTLIVVLGTLFYVRIQVHSYLRFYLAAALASFVFTLLLYSLTYALGAVGEAIGVIFMVVQVAGSGGTFPIEVLPWIYQILYPFMPFQYGINALRECIGGFYGMAYWQDLGYLLLFIPLAVLIGRLLSRPLEGLFRQMEKSKEGSDLFV